MKISSLVRQKKVARTCTCPTRRPQEDFHFLHCATATFERAAGFQQGGEGRPACILIRDEQTRRVTVLRLMQRRRAVRGTAAAADYTVHKLYTCMYS